MGILSRFTRTKYDDERIASRVRIAVDEDPLIEDPTSVIIASDKGVVTVTGTVHKEPDKDRVEGVIRSTLRVAGLKHERIVNELEVH